MNTNLIQSDWNLFKGKLKQTWALITDDPRMYRRGRADEHLGRILRKAGEKRAALEKVMRECDELREQTDKFSKCTSFSDRHERPLDVQRKESWCLL